MKEYWDAYLENGEKADIILIRGEKIPDGLYHLVVDLAIRHVDGDFLLMKRSASKKTYPGMFELSAGGSVLMGESPFDGAKRELAEETGIVNVSLRLLNRFADQKTKALYYEFFGITDCDKNSITCQEGETEDFLWASEQKVKEFYQQGLIIPSCIKRKPEIFQGFEN